MARSRTPPLPWRKHCCALANCGFATVFAAPKLSGLWHLGRSAAEAQSYAHPKMGVLKRTVWQLRAAKVRDVAEKLPHAQTAHRKGRRRWQWQ
jgi:hypothetical protein